MKRLLTRLTLVGALTAAVLTPAAPAQASRFMCGSAVPSSFAGSETGPSGSNHFEGITGHGTNRTALMCGTVTTASNFTSDWVMIHPLHGGWAQTGLNRDPTYSTSGVCERYFAEYMEKNDTTGAVASYSYAISSACATIGAAHDWTVLWDGTCACLRMMVDSSTYLTTPFKPFNSIWTPPLDLEIEGEVTYPTGSDIPGSPSLKADITTVNYQSYVDNNWYSTCSAGPGTAANPLSAASVQWTGAGPNRYAASNTCDSVHVWTATP